MPELILHHYDASPFSEKVRLMLGYKGLPWRSVQVPMVMPKPEVVALTGGYRRTPFVQLGADIHCDTALIARLLEKIAPEPTLFPADAPLAALLAEWADSALFWAAIAYTMQPAGCAHVLAGWSPEAIRGFAADRASFTAGLRRQTVADATVALESTLAALDAQLADGRAHLFGRAASVADFAVAHCAWTIRRGGPVAQIVARNGHFAAWLDRMLAIGHGRSEPMGASQAIELAAASPAPADCRVEPGLGFEPGQQVSVTPTDYGCDAVAGALVGLSADEVVVARSDARAGRLHVHFPRRGFQLKAETALT